MHEISKEKYYTMIIDNDLTLMGQSAYGEVNHDNETISINFALTGKVGDIVLTVLHEVCHGILGGVTDSEISREHLYIYNVEKQYMNILYSFGVISKRFKNHIEHQEDLSWGKVFPLVPISHRHYVEEKDAVTAELQQSIVPI